jgi:hypothetical protein
VELLDGLQEIHGPRLARNDVPGSPGGTGARPAPPEDAGRRRAEACAALVGAR